MKSHRSQHLVGQSLSQYTFRRKLGQGAWGTVYEVIDSKTNTLVACKLIPREKFQDEPKLKELVQNEIAVLKKCHNVNVVGYVATIIHNDDVFIFMEYCNGGDFLDYLARKGSVLPQDEAVSFLRQIINGFKGLREIQASHRDFKSANILLHNGMLKIADLGFAKFLKEGATTDTLLGTMETMAPELLSHKGSYGPECDIWSLGVVYYHWIVGKYPYVAPNDYEMLKRIRNQPLTYPPHISRASRNFIAACLVVDPSKRIKWNSIWNHELLAEKSRIGRAAFQNSIQPPMKTRSKTPLVREQQQFQLQQAPNLAKLEEEARARELQEQEKMRVGELYINHRNFILLAVKYVIVPMHEDIQYLGVDPSLPAFFIYKRVYIDISRYVQQIHNRNNVFGVTHYWQNFMRSEEYNEIFQMVLGDQNIIESNTKEILENLKPETVKKPIRFDLVLKQFSNFFEASYKEVLQEYANALFQRRNSEQCDKNLILKTVAFIRDLLTKKVKGTFTEYTRAFEQYNLAELEQRVLNEVH